MRDPRFTRTVIYMCAHTTDGAMGLVINRLVGSHQLPRSAAAAGHLRPVRPASISASTSAARSRPAAASCCTPPTICDDATLRVGDAVGLTATLDILRDIAAGHGPRRSLLALGYAGWGPGQLDAEIQANGWLCVPAGRGADVRRRARPTSGNARSARSASTSASSPAKPATPDPARGALPPPSSLVIPAKAGSHRTPACDYGCRLSPA